MSELGKKGGYMSGENDIWMSFDNPGLSAKLFAEWRKQHLDATVQDFASLYCNGNDTNHLRDECVEFVLNNIRRKHPDKTITSISDLTLDSVTYLQEACISYASDGYEDNQLSNVGNSGSGSSIGIGTVGKCIYAKDLLLAKHALNIEIERRMQANNPNPNSKDILFSTDWNDVEVDYETGMISGYYRDHIGGDVEFKTGRLASAQKLIENFNEIVNTSANCILLCEDGESASSNLIPADWRSLSAEALSGNQIRVSGMSFIMAALEQMRSTCACHSDCDGYAICRGYGYVPCYCYGYTCSYCSKHCASNAAPCSHQATCSHSTCTCYSYCGHY